MRDPFDRVLGALREFEKIEPRERARFIYVTQVMMDVLYGALFKIGKVGAPEWEKLNRTMDKIDELTGRAPPPMPTPEPQPAKSDLLQWLENLGAAHAGEQPDHISDGPTDAGAGD
jgi:hypothetical protein